MLDAVLPPSAALAAETVNVRRWHRPQLRWAIVDLVEVMVGDDDAVACEQRATGERRGQHRPAAADSLPDPARRFHFGLGEPNVVSKGHHQVSQPVAAGR